MNRPFARRLRFFERGCIWTIGWLLATLVLCVTIAMVGLGALPGLPRIVRGYTGLGVTLGIVSVLLVLLAALYSVRKRALQEWMPLRSTLMAWLNGHVVLGLLALGVALGHAGFGAVSLQPSTGKVLLLLLLVLTFSGIWWRLIYRVVPSMAAKALSGQAAGTAGRTTELQAEMDKISAGRSREFLALRHWVETNAPGDAQIQQAAAALDADDAAALFQTARLAEGRRRALEHDRISSRYTRRMQLWRITHVPLTLVFLVFIPIHVLGALEIPAKFVPMTSVATLPFELGSYEKSGACRECHETIVEQWRTSMHSHAMTSPLMIAQTNQVVREALAGQPSPDPLRVCVNCHGPLGTAMAQQATLPLAVEGGDAELLNEGISCAVCHQWRGEPATGGAGLAKFQAGFVPGRTYLGPLRDPVPNAFHKSEHHPIFDKPSELCRNCHSVQVDKNGDGRFVKGTDLVLQTLYDEWKRYESGATCISCHMPELRAETRAAEAATLVFEQDYPAPERTVRDHSFVGPDYPLDVPWQKDPMRARRDSLLRRAAEIEIVAESILPKRGTLTFDVSIQNSGVGHNLPGGFAFVRQMWLEVKLTDEDGKLLSSSGVLDAPTDDLCDAATLEGDGAALSRFVEGCRAPDPLLANFQAQLVDRIEVAVDASGITKTDDRGEPVLIRAETGKETWLQYLDSGAVARVRPFDKKPLTVLFPGEERIVRYTFETGAKARPKTIDVRLLFRPVPPYFVRALASGQRSGEPNLLALVGNIYTSEMAKASASVTAAER